MDTIWQLFSVIEQLVLLTFIHYKVVYEEQKARLMKQTRKTVKDENDCDRWELFQHNISSIVISPSLSSTHALSESTGRMQINKQHAVKAMPLPVEVICGLETVPCTEDVKRGVCAVELSSVLLTEHEQMS